MPAVIQQGPVTYDGNTGQITNPDNYTGICVEYFFENFYENDPHKYMASQTSPQAFNGSTVGFVQIGNPTTLWVCEWTACQLGAKPIAPSPIPESSGWVLLDVHPTLAGKSIVTDGQTPIYRISGVYIYGHKNPNADVYRDAVFPIYPWVANSDGRQMLSSDFKKGLLDGVGTANTPGQLQGSVQVQQG
jgi:hypothetical protein